MRLAVFGATGGTGVQVIRQALRQGHRVTALVRRPEALSIEDSHLSVIRGDVLTDGAAEAAVDGADAVVSALGIGMHRHATTVYSAGTGNILAAMSRTGVERLLVVSTSSLRIPERRQVPEWLVTRFLLHPMLKRPYADMAAMEKRVVDSGIAWTLVRAARLTDQPARGDYRIALDHKLRGCWSISRADLAGYLLDHIRDQHIYQRTVEIAN
jgi:putative NADH-flavin reductase